jgi:hypothetical protein
MYLEKLKEKFTNFDTDFEYLGYYRKFKKTIIQLKCKKCGAILEKEQYNTLNRNKTLYCFDCKCVKKAKPLDYDLIIKKFELNGCKDIKIVGNKIKGICKCGKNFEKGLYDLQYYNCTKCSLDARIYKNAYKEEDVRKWFLANNLIPLFDKYESANKNLKYLCFCGNISEIRYSRRFEHDENWKPMCKKCAMILKNSKENHWNWKEGNKYKGKKHWSRKIKKIFNNECCISGEKTNLVAHHLNAANLNFDDVDNTTNGVCITNKLHVEFHLKYDNFKGTCLRKDFEEFFYEKTNINFNDYLKNKKYYEN